MTGPPIPDDAYVGRRIIEAAETMGARMNHDMYEVLGEVLGLSRIPVYRILHGKTTASLNHLRAVARWSDLPLGWFVS